MSKFIDAFKAGQAAAENAQRARQEIAEVFQELNKELRAETGGRINIERRKKVHPFTAAIVRIPLGNIQEDTQEDNDQILVGYNPSISTGKVWKLADWNVSSSGYPCTISWGGNDYSCFDRQSLEEQLKNLIEDAGIAEKLRAAITESTVSTSNGSLSSFT